MNTDPNSDPVSQRHRHATGDRHPQLARRAETPHRVEAISDGIFAVALTLLVLDIRVPLLAVNASPQALYLALMGLAPRLLVYLASFFIVSFYWVSHHLVFSAIERSDRTLMWLNLVFLLPVAFLPFSAAVLSEYHAYQISVWVYGTNLLICALALLLLWHYASRNNNLIHADVPATTIRGITARFSVMPVTTIVAMAIAFFSTTASIVLFIATPMWYIATGVRRSIVDEEAGLVTIENANSGRTAIAEMPDKPNQQ